MAQTKEGKQRNISRKHWKFLIYEDSSLANVPETFKTLAKYDSYYEGIMAPVWLYLESLEVPIVVSPRHDQDVKEDGSGDLDKPHYHGLVEFDGPTPYLQALEAFKPIGVKKLLECKSKRSSEQYLIHMNSPWKAQYDAAEILSFGGYKVKFLDEKYEQNSIRELHDLIEELGITNFADLGNEVSSNHDELMGTLLRYQAYFNNICRARNEMKKYADKMSYVKYKYLQTRFSGLGR